MTLERHKYMHTQMQKIYYCLLNAHMWTKDVHVDKRDRTHKMKKHIHAHYACRLMVLLLWLCVYCYV